MGLLWRKRNVSLHSHFYGTVLNSVIIKLIRLMAPSESAELGVAKRGPPLPGLICTLVVMEPSAKTLMLPLTL